MYCRCNAVTTCAMGRQPLGGQHRAASNMFVTCAKCCWWVLVAFACRLLQGLFVESCPGWRAVFIIIDHGTQQQGASAAKQSKIA